MEIWTTELHVDCWTNLSARFCWFLRRQNDELNFRRVWLHASGSAIRVCSNNFLSFIFFFFYVYIFYVSAENGDLLNMNKNWSLCVRKTASRFTVSRLALRPLEDDDDLMLTFVDDVQSTMTAGCCARHASLFSNFCADTARQTGYLEKRRAI